MEQCFVSTDNVSQFAEICEELESRDSLIGPSLGVVVGPAGRGKSEAARRYATQGSALYIPPMNVRSPMAVLQDIVFDLCSLKPGRISSCLESIGAEMFRSRRLVIIDEADLLEMKVLEMLRNVNERYGCPILLVGEEGLRGKIASRRRLASRVRMEMAFGPVLQADIAMFFRRSLQQDIGLEGASLVEKHCEGDWRPVLKLAVDIERAMSATGLKRIPVEMVAEMTAKKGKESRLRRERVGR